MATTILAVCNRALSKIGAPRINTLSEDTPSAVAVGACFPSLPDWVLRAYRWRFALKRVVLAEAVYRAFSLLKGHPYHRAGSPSGL